MNTRKNKNSLMLTLTFPLGIVFFLCAAVYSYIEQSVNFLSIAFALFGVFSFLFCLVYNLKFDKTVLDNNQAAPKIATTFQWSRGVVFMMVTVFLIVMLIGVNYLSHRIDYRWDMTQYQQHTLTQATIDFVGDIEQPIELTAFYVGLPPKYLEDLLNEYERITNGKISANIVDPIEDIAYAAKFGNVISGKERKLIVISGDERKDVDFSDVSLSEEHITNALARVAREPQQVYFLTGHGEFSALDKSNLGFSLFADLLNSNNISSKSLMLGTAGSIPDDCDVLIVAGPRTDLTDQEERLIQDYLEQGGDALFLIESVIITSPEKTLTAEQEGKHPSLNSILNQWGIHVGNDIVVDLSSHMGGDVGSPATRNYNQHKAITEGLDYTFYIRPRSITTLKDRRATVKLNPIVLSATKEQSWAETNRSLNIRFDEGADIPGPVAISSIIWEKKAPDDESDTRIIVFTDADFLSNAYLNQYSNAAMGINVVNWLAELDYAVFHDQKNIKVERLDLTSKQKRSITALLLLMPLFIAMIGSLVWMRPWASHQA